MQEKSIFLVTISSIAFVAIVGFVISYNSLRHVALAGGKAEWESWLWPIIIDVAIAAFTFASVFAVKRGASPWFPRTLVAFFTLLTIVFNAAGSAFTPLHLGVALTAPFAFFFSFEVLIWLVAKSENAPVIANAKLQETDKNERKIVDNASRMQKGRQQKIEQRRKQVQALFAEGMDVNAIAKAVGVKDARTIKNDIKALNGHLQ